jgi:hypothetical protein
VTDIALIEALFDRAADVAWWTASALTAATGFAGVAVKRRRTGSPPDSRATSSSARVRVC